MNPSLPANPPVATPYFFYGLAAIMLVPMYLLIGIWGGPRKLYAAIKFFLYTLAGSVLMLLGILFLYFHHHAASIDHIYTFAIPELYKTAPQIYSDYGPTAATLLFLSFFFAFAIKVPMFPFHTWLPDAHVEAPTAGSVILAGVLLKMGTYGFIRFSLPFFPDVLHHGSTRFWVMVLSVIAIIYGALVSLMAIASAVCGLAQGKAVAAATESLARNPAARPGIQFALILGLVLIESLALYTLAIIFLKVK